MLLTMLVALMWPCGCVAKCSASVESVSKRKRKARERVKPTHDEFVEDVEVCEDVEVEDMKIRRYRSVEDRRKKRKMKMEHGTWNMEVWCGR